MTEYEKMLAGELYFSADPFLTELRAAAKARCEAYNLTPRADEARRSEILKDLLGGFGGGICIEANVWFDYGRHTVAGENFYVNHDCVFLDCAKITFGDNVFIAPQCGFYTAGHPLDAATRNALLEFAKPITVGNGVWFGGGVKVLPGVTIGDNVVVGAGSVVTRDVPSNTVVAGVPARILRRLTRPEERN